MLSVGGFLLVVVQGEVSKVLPERMSLATTSDAANVDTIAGTTASLGIESEANLTAIRCVADEGVLRLVVLALSRLLAVSLASVLAKLALALVLSFVPLLGFPGSIRCRLAFIVA